ncbi:hypothetical protein PSM36_3087 [Proteiniphilum saccharofermentans]|uniref:Uncharacterized protein n=1 Tax=Proteiniphilum saccharofermentans TaxID=1642647 RepID=A0A1R3T0C8_9BACT|nr:hypothetical protein PSM36_3087 [Proteiniphilum saccharofermentans]
MKKYKCTYGIRLSKKNFGFENGIKSVPLYAVISNFACTIFGKIECTEIGNMQCT